MSSWPGPGRRQTSYRREAVKGILVNPIYTGLGPFPRLVEDAAGSGACAKLIEEEGPQILVNLLFVLREWLPAEST